VAGRISNPGLEPVHRFDFRSYMAMHNRCSNPTLDNWEHYGGVGSKVCTTLDRPGSGFLKLSRKTHAGRPARNRKGQDHWIAKRVNGHYTPKNLQVGPLPVYKKANRRCSKISKEDLKVLEEMNEEESPY